MTTRIDRTQRAARQLRARARPRLGAASRAVVVLVLFGSVVLRHGWRTPPIDPGALDVLAAAALAAHALLLFAAARRLARGLRAEFLRVTRPEQIITGAGLALAFLPEALGAAGVLLALTTLLRFYLFLVQRSVPPGLVFVSSFVLLTGVGAAVLKLPASTPPDQPISTLDAVFTVTSAISQTGLVVRPTGEGFTRFGQTVIMIWIEVGALGVIVFGALLANIIGSSFGLRATKTIAEGTEAGWAGQLSMQRLVTFIIAVTLTLNVVGAAAFYLAWPDDWPGMPADFATPGDRLFHSVFFSVSSFCNAGFVTTADSMQGLRAHAIPHLIIVPLILLGSIGFPVLDNIASTVRHRLRGRVTAAGGALVRLSLNTKLILATQGLLYLVGFGLIFAGEAVQTDQPLHLAALDAHFMNVNRTSGFDTIPPAEMGLLSVLTLILLMFIGGSPASVAGGIKIMVFAVLILTVIATIRGKPQTTVFGRTLPDALVRKCAVIAVLALATVMATTGVLAVTETARPGAPGLTEILFEATSAAATTGLSMGITSDLTPAGRVAVCIAMFVGRVGPLALLAGLFSVARRPGASYAYPTEEVVVY